MPLGERDNMRSFYHCLTLALTLHPLDHATEFVWAIWQQPASLHFDFSELADADFKFAMEHRIQRQPSASKPSKEPLRLAYISSKPCDGPKTRSECIHHFPL